MVEKTIDGKKISTPVIVGGKVIEKIGRIRNDPTGGINLRVKGEHGHYVMVKEQIVSMEELKDRGVR